MLRADISPALFEFANWAFEVYAEVAEFRCSGAPDQLAPLSSGLSRAVCGFGANILRISALLAIHRTSISTSSGRIYDAPRMRSEKFAEFSRPILTRLGFTIASRGYERYVCAEAGSADRATHFGK